MRDVWLLHGQCQQIFFLWNNAARANFAAGRGDYNSILGFAAGNVNGTMLWCATVQSEAGSREMDRKDKS
jgi:hypothetical protein